MRWAGSAARSESTDLRAYPAYWQNTINASHLDTGGNNAYNTRAKLKVNARESRLLNDIPPPVITVSGGKAVITRPGIQGALYYTFGYSTDPKDAYLEPEFTSVSPGMRDPEIQTGEIVTARVYGPDLDGIPAWSAPITTQAP
jgi:hypothetical protein